MRKVFDHFVILIASWLITFGLLKLCIDFVTWWQTPRFHEWEWRWRMAFLIAWLSMTLIFFVLGLARRAK